MLPAVGLAQDRVETAISPPPTVKPRLTPRRPAAQAPAEEEDTQAPPPQPRAGDQEDEEDTDEPSHAPRLAPSAGGWDATAAREPEGPLDGVVDVAEPAPVHDGTADLTRDPWFAEDIAAFSRPPAGYDPYLFQIELEPLADRRTGGLFRLEPYVARGVRIGSFVIFPEAELGLAATNNIFRSSPRQDDHALEARANVRAVSDWRAHAMELRASGFASFHDAHPTEDDRAYTLEARGRLDLTRRTNVEVLAARQLDRDVRSLVDSPTAAAARGDIETTRAAVALNHRFNRLSLQLRGSIADTDFAPVASAGGGIILNDERDSTRREGAFRTSWALNRRFDVFAEVAVNDREYHAAPADGILRSSTGERYRVGIAFAPTGTALRGEVSTGWGRQQPGDARLGGIDGVIVDASLAWRATPLTTFLLTARSDFVDTTATGSAGGLSRLVGLEARHALRRHLIATAGIRYAVTSYEGIDVTEQELSGELGLEYYLGRDTILFGRYQHVVYERSTPMSDYTADIVRVGVRVRR